MPDAPDVVLKQGDPASLRREARGARLAGTPLAPRVISMGAGELRSARIAGRPRRLARLDPDRCAALGRVLARVHARRTTLTGGLPGWPARVRDLAAYARGRGRDALARTRSSAERDLVEHATASAEAAASMTERGPLRFALLHGDLVEQNIVWPAGGADPVLVDWEFWRMGDPAEDLAYLGALNDLPAEAGGHVFRGYGADWPLMAAVDLWRPLVLADAALWLRAHGDAAAGGRLLRASAREMD